MRLATFVDPRRGHDARFGIVSGDNIVDVVAAADALHRAVPATSVKTRAHQRRAHARGAEGTGRPRPKRQSCSRPIAGVKFLPPIPDPSKFFCVGKNNKKHREELAANKMLTEVPNEPTGFIKLISTMSGDGDEVVEARRHHHARLRAGALLRRRQARPWRQEGRGDGLHRGLHADQRHQRPRNPAARGRLRQPVLDRQEHAGLRRRSAPTS